MEIDPIELVNNNFKKLEDECREADLLLKDGATNLVFGKGSASAQILFVGEAPGKNEDLEGFPFVGCRKESGQTFERGRTEFRRYLCY